MEEKRKENHALCRINNLFPHEGSFHRDSATFCSYSRCPNDMVVRELDILDGRLIQLELQTVRAVRTKE